MIIEEEKIRQLGKPGNLQKIQCTWKKGSSLNDLKQGGGFLSKIWRFPGEIQEKEILMSGAAARTGSLEEKRKKRKVE